MFNEVIKLVKETKGVDQYGDATITTSERVIFAEVKSISQSEFYASQSAGLKPEIKFVIPDFLDYQNEKRIKYKPYAGVEEDYTVLRTFRSGTVLEIVCKRGID